MPSCCIRHHPAFASGRLRAARRFALFLLSGLAFSAASAPVAFAQDVRQAASPARDPIAGYVTEAALRFGVPEHWIRAVLHVESAGDRAAVSSAGAMGLMQVMPDTWAELRIRHRLGTDPFDPRDNILAGTAYMREMLDRYGNIGAMLAAYNAGPGRYDDYLATGRALPAETRAYVAALVPQLGGDVQPVGAATATPPVTDWREASLFVAQSDGAQAAPVLHAEGGADGAESMSPAPAPPHALAPSGELFVARTRPEDAP